MGLSASAMRAKFGLSAGGGVKSIGLGYGSGIDKSRPGQGEMSSLPSAGGGWTAVDVTSIFTPSNPLPGVPMDGPGSSPWVTSVGPGRLGKSPANPAVGTPAPVPSRFSPGGWTTPSRFSTGAVWSTPSRYSPGGWTSTRNRQTEKRRGPTF